MIALLGGMGFLGKAVGAKLHARGQTPLILDMVEAEAGVRFAAALGGQYRQVDFHNPEELKQKLEGVDTVIHFISTSVPGTANQDVRRDITDNVAASVGLFDAALAAGVTRVVFLSSGGTVYGQASRLPTPEDEPLRPMSAYGAAKAAIEGYLQFYAQARGLAASIIRLSNPYGPGQSPFRGQGAVAVFAHAIINGLPIELWGDGKSLRDYIFIDDAAQAIVLICEEEAALEVYNVGSGQGVSTIDLLARIESNVGKRANTIFRPARSFDVPASILDVTKIKALGWIMEHDLDEGIAKTIRYLGATV